MCVCLPLLQVSPGSMIQFLNFYIGSRTPVKSPPLHLHGLRLHRRPNPDAAPPKPETELDDLPSI